MTIDRKILEAAMTKYVNAAEGKAEAAGFNGAYHDGGCGTMLRELNAYKEGLRGVVPNFLFSYYTQAENEADPEYPKYQELKEKFED